MRAIVYAGHGEVRLGTVPDPVVVDPHDAIVRVQRAAVCGTDLHVVNHPGHLPVGFVLGHEFVGEVIETGPAVQALAVGDRVAGTDYTACGRCWWCRHGSHWQCPERKFFGTGTAFGPALPGTQAELVRVPHADVTLHHLPEAMSPEAAVFLGDVLATGYAAIQRADPRPGSTIAIVGGGPVGQLASLVAQACGAGPVVVVEPVASRRNVAAENGAVPADPGRAADVVRQLSDGRGADAVIDAVGGPVGLDTALKLVRRRGTVVSVGVHADEHWALPVARSFADELTLGFAVGDLIRDADELTALVTSGAVDPTVIVSNVVRLDEVPGAYAQMAGRVTLKTLVMVADPPGGGE